MRSIYNLYRSTARAKRDRETKSTLCVYARRFSRPLAYVPLSICGLFLDAGCRARASDGMMQRVHLIIDRCPNRHEFWSPAHLDKKPQRLDRTVGTTTPRNVNKGIGPHCSAIAECARFDFPYPRRSPPDPDAEITASTKRWTCR